MLVKFESRLDAAVSQTNEDFTDGDLGPSAQSLLNISDYLSSSPVVLSERSVGLSTASHELLPFQNQD
jgi:hypothetical protein